MKLCKNVKVYGIERIVFDRITTYILEDKDKNYAGVWRRIESPRSGNEKSKVGLIENQQMAKNINAICNTKEYIVELNGATIYVSTIPQQPTENDECECECGCNDEGCECETPTLVIVCPRHGE